MLILLATNEHPGMINLSSQFWLHEHGWPWKLAGVAEESLAVLGIKFKTELINGEMDYTECFR